MAARITARFWVILAIAALLIWQPGNFIFASADRQTKPVEPAKPATPAAEASAAPSISAGALHACALQADGSLTCWGRNDEGQLSIPEPNSGFTQVSAGGYHTCALKADGSVVCWGQNDSGQSTTPAENSGFKLVSAGVQHTCALKVDGSIQCWGEAADGQTIPPAENSGFIQVSSGGYHTCALKVDGTIACWGRTLDGQNISPGGSNFIQVSAGGYHNCALSADGSLACWGRGYEGQTTLPAENSGFRDISMGGGHSCGLKVDGTIACWGIDEEGQIDIPAGSTDITQVSAGGHNTCALSVDGTLSCWGLNDYGQSSPPVLTGGSGANIAISTGVYHTCSLKADGSISCWGNPDNGRTNIPAPNHLFIQVEAFETHTCGLRANGSLACWGSNEYGKATPPVLNSDLVQVDGGQLQTCALKADGSVLCWGSNIYGELNIPADNSNFKQISAGGHSACGLKADGSIACWGWLPDDQGNIPEPNSGFTQVSVNMYNTCGLKADGSLRCWGYPGYSQNNVPAPNSGFTQVDVGFNHTCAMRTAGSIACWGAGSAGQSGNIPAPNNGFTRMDAGGGHSCAIKADGSMTCWGDNASGRAPVINYLPAAMPGGIYNEAYSQALTASGGTLPASGYRFDLISGALPAGIGMSDTGLFSGTPSQVGSSSFSIKIFDDNQYFSTRSLSLAVAKATPAASLSLTNLPVTYDGADHPADVVLVSSSVPGTIGNIRYNGSTTVPRNAGSYAVTASFFPADSTHYNTLTEVSAGDLIINQATPTASLAVDNSPTVYSGEPQSAAVIVATSSVPGTVGSVLTGGSAAQTGAGTYPVSASFIPTDTTNYITLHGLSAGNFVINKATPTVDVWVTNTPVTFNGQPHSASVNASASVPGSFGSQLTGGAPEQSQAGSYLVTIPFTPTDTDNYHSVTGSAAEPFVILKATPTVSLGITNTPVTYTGLAQSAAVSLLGSSVPGTLSNIQTGDAPSQTSAGSYEVTASFVPADTSNYHTLTGQSAGVFVIEKANPVVDLTVTNSPITYDGTPHAAAVEITTSSVPGTLSGVLVGGAPSQTNAGSYPVTASFIPQDADNYHTLTALSAGSFVISRAAPTASAALTNSPVTYNGEAHTAAVEIVSSSVPGSLTGIRYNESTSAPINAGEYAVTADFIPADTDNYSPILQLAVGSLVIEKATPSATVILDSPDITFDGLPHMVVVKVQASSVPGTASTIRIGGATSRTNAGTYPVTASFVPDDSSNYHTLADLPAGSFTIEKAAPSATLTTTNSPVVYDGSPQEAVVEIASASIPGSLINVRYAGSSSRPVNAGIYPVTADFIPTDTTNYTSLFGISAGAFTIEKAVPTASYTVAGLPIGYDGKAHAAEVSLLSASVPGTTGQVLAGGSASQTDAGAYPVTVEFIPMDDENYQRLTGLPAGNLVIEKAVLTVTAQDLVKPVGSSFPIPELVYTVQGFVNGETASVLTGAPLLSVAALPGSSSGLYPILITQGTLAAKNYSFVFVAGSLEIEKSIQYMPFLIVTQK